MNEMINVNNNDGNFDMQTLMNITGQNAMIVNNLNQQMGIVTSSINSIRSDVGVIRDELDQLKLNEEITTDQAETIIERARSRVVAVLGEYDKKYFKRFIARLYSDAKKYRSLGSSIYRTHKGNYQMVLNYIEAWMPREGTAEFKNKIDRGLRE